MNIFATGMNPADANALKRKPRVALFQAVTAMMDRLKVKGHHLEWSRLVVGDEIPHDTDAVIVSVMLPRSLNCPYALGAMWAIHQALDREIPLVLYLTDWAFFRAHSEFRSIAKAGQPYFSKQIGGQLQYNEPPAMIAKHGPELTEVCRQWGNPQSRLWEKAQVLVPRYTHWGNVDIVQRMLPGANPVLTMDPTPSFLDYLNSGPLFPVAPLDQRKRAWLLPSLLKDDTWVNQQILDWPVHRFGPKGFQVLDDERMVNRTYGMYAGALCPPYPTAGSGWWRSRWIHAALARTALLCSPFDAREVGPGYLHTGRELEQLNNAQLAGIADEQARSLWSKIQPEFGVMDAQIAGALEKAGA